MWLKRRAPATTTLTAADARPVRYEGVRMRSVLEGRWACCFSHLGVPWEYEPEPVRVDGRNRWPDLWLPEHGVWVEIKPAHTPVDSHFALSVAEETGSPLIWLAGSPWPGDYSASICDFGGLDVVSGLRWAVGRRDQALWLMDPGAMVRIPLPLREAGEEELWPLFDCHRTRVSYQIASGFRFEEPAP